MEKYQMGVEYFKIDGTTGSKEKLRKLFEELGFIFVGEVGKDPYYSRIDSFTNNKGLDFYTEWFINLAHIRFGNWENGLVEIDFDSIKGSYLPYCDHETLSFMRGGVVTGTLAVPRLTE